MIEIKIPGYKGNDTIQLRHLVLDYNGTLAYDGQLLTGVRECLKSLADKIQIHVLTADTFGNVRSLVEDIPCTLFILPAENQEIGKLEYVKHLGCEHTISVGNGRNDRLMLKESALGIAVILGEGACCGDTVSR